jgi:ATP-dependent helicase/DNAse subunit B
VVELLRALGHGPEHSDVLHPLCWDVSGACAGAVVKKTLLLNREEGQAGVRNDTVLGKVHAWMQGRVHSVSQMDVLGDCRLKYVLQHFLGCNKPSVLQHVLQPRDEGDVWHRALYHVYQGLVREKPFEQWRLTPEEACVYAKRVFEKNTALLLSKTHAHSVTQNKTLQETWQVVLKQLKDDLEPSEYVPCFFEYPFYDLGLEGVLKDGGVLRVKGTLDRIDGGASGAWRVLDYKRRVKERSEDRQMQVPLYACVVLREKGGGHVQGVLSGLKEGKRKVLFEHTRESLDAQVQGRVLEHAQPVLEGVWNANPDPVQKQLCMYCDVKHVCKIRARGVEEDV